MIRSVYRSLELYLRAAGYTASLLVDDVAMHDEAAFSQLLWSDLVTLGGPTLVVHPVAYESEGELLGVAYEARWDDAPAPEAVRALSEHLRGMSLREVLDQAADADAGLVGVVEVTTFRVSARVEGRSRTYRAAVLWIVGEDHRRWMALQDHVILGVDQVIHEESRPSSQVEILNAWRKRVDAGG